MFIFFFIFILSLILNKSSQRIFFYFGGQWGIVARIWWRDYYNFFFFLCCSVMFNSLWPHGLFRWWILQARILEWVAFPFSRGSSQPRDGSQVSCIAGGSFTSWATTISPYSWKIRSIMITAKILKVKINWTKKNVGNNK